MVNSSKKCEITKHDTKEVITTITKKFTVFELFIFSAINREKIIKKWNELCEIHKKGVLAKNNTQSFACLAAVLFAVSLYNYMQSVRFS